MFFHLTINSLETIETRNKKLEISKQLAVAVGRKSSNFEPEARVRLKRIEHRREVEDSLMDFEMAVAKHLFSLIYFLKKINQFEIKRKK